MKEGISSSDFATDSSTKLSNKLEISVTNLPGSTRDLNLISRTSKVQKTESSSNIKILNNDGIKFTNIKSKLPYISMAVDMTSTATQIKRDFISTMQSNDIRVTGDENSESLQAQDFNDNFLKRCFKCFGLFSTEEKSILLLTTKYSENKYERIIDLKGISGNISSISHMIFIFVKNFSKNVKKLRILRNTHGLDLDSLLKDQIDSNRRNSLRRLGSNSYESLTDEDNSLVDTSNKEASNLYEFYRILSQENYDLGKSVSDFVENFKLKNRTDEVKCAKQMEEILKFVDDCVSTFFCYFNFGKSNTEKMLPYCRPAVEKFIFNKLYFILYENYSNQYNKENLKFIENQTKIKGLKLDEIMGYLEINKKFRGNREDGHIPYKTTIDCINKIEYEQCPKDKFDSLMKASLDLRNTILDMTKGKCELNSMDDELPIFIFLTTQISIKNMPAELNMIDDYIRYSKSIDKESKVLTNLISSVYFISNDWIVE